MHTYTYISTNLQCLLSKPQITGICEHLADEHDIL